MKIYPVLLSALIFMAMSCAKSVAYDRSLAVCYATSWWNTDGDTWQDTAPSNSNNHFVDHVDTPTYNYYYCDDNIEDDAHRNKIDNTNFDDKYNMIPRKWGFDCANFVSQCLNAGGVVLAASKLDGRGDTITGASSLGGVLASTSEVTAFTNSSGAPSNLTIGDVIIFDNAHALIVVGGSGSGVVLAAHTSDRSDATIQGQFNYRKKAVTYHILGNSTQAPSDNTPPVFHTYIPGYGNITDGQYVDRQLLNTEPVPPLVET